MSWLGQKVRYNIATEEVTHYAQIQPTTANDCSKVEQISSPSNTIALQVAYRTARTGIAEHTSNLDIEGARAELSWKSCDSTAHFFDKIWDFVKKACSGHVSRGLIHDEPGVSRKSISINAEPRIFIPPWEPPGEYGDAVNYLYRSEFFGGRGQ